MIKHLTILLSLILLTQLVMLGQERFPWEPPWKPGQQEAPPNYTCTPDGYIIDGKQTDTHPCHCKRISYECDGEGYGRVTEDGTCNVVCKETHQCNCPVACVNLPSNGRDVPDAM